MPATRAWTGKAKSRQAIQRRLDSKVIAALCNGIIQEDGSVGNYEPATNPALHNKPYRTNNALSRFLGEHGGAAVYRTACRQPRRCSLRSWRENCDHHADLSRRNLTSVSTFSCHTAIFQNVAAAFFFVSQRQAQYLQFPKMRAPLLVWRRYESFRGWPCSRAGHQQRYGDRHTVLVDPQLGTESHKRRSQPRTRKPRWRITQSAIDAFEAARTRRRPPKAAYGECRRRGIQFYA